MTIPSNWAAVTDEQLLRGGGHEFYDHINPTPEAREKMKAVVLEAFMADPVLGNQTLVSCVLAAVQPLLAQIPGHPGIEIERDDTPGSLSALSFTVRSGEHSERWVRLDVSSSTHVALWHGRGRSEGVIYRSRAVFQRKGEFQGLAAAIARAVVRMLQGLRTEPVLLLSKESPSP